MRVVAPLNSSSLTSLLPDVGWPVSHSKKSLDLLDAGAGTGVASAAKRAKQTETASTVKDPNLSAKFEAALATLARLELPCAVHEAIHICVRFAFSVYFAICMYSLFIYKRS